MSHREIKENHPSFKYQWIKVPKDGWLIGMTFDELCVWRTFGGFDFFETDIIEYGDEIIPQDVVKFTLDDLLINVYKFLAESKNSDFVNHDDDSVKAFFLDFKEYLRNPDMFKEDLND
jgi:hypothetical protein